MQESLNAKPDVPLLSSRIFVHACNKLMKSQAETDCQIGILKCQLVRIHDNIAHLSNMPGHPLVDSLMLLTAMAHGDQ